VPYLRLTADRRGYEHTFLLHVAAPGTAPKVLYWYRTAPGLRIGRPPLDDGAMRALEAQYPDIDFDWPYILDMGAMTPVEIEAPLPPRRRKPRQTEPDLPQDPTPAADPDSLAGAPGPEAEPSPVAAAPAPAEPAAEDSAAGPDLLADLLGRGIAATLRARHRLLATELAAQPPGRRDALLPRLQAIDPDTWTTPEAVLAGMATIEAEIDAIRGALRDG
jgi:hypothetical protein